MTNKIKVLIKGLHASFDRSVLTTVSPEMFVSGTIEPDKFHRHHGFQPTRIWCQVEPRKGHIFKIKFITLARANPGLNLTHYFSFCISARPLISELY